ncbi:MAG TPA: hypothetical protein VEH04_13000 [Verrucomicrobiae bacterium]|nr:hypothetical protein [Verrucomicrobiae bacterium]
MKCHPAISIGHCIAACLLVAFFSPAFAWSTAGQGTVQPISVLRTGAGGPLVSGSQTFFVPQSAQAQQITIAVGFGTDEIVLPETIFDSLTLTIEDAAASLSALFLTMDITGTFWAPPGSGLFIDADSIGRELIDFPEIPGGSPANRTAYSLTLPIPAEMTGHSLTLYLDLFDNGNGLPSLGWMSQVIAVPEPAAGMFVLLGALLLVARNRSQKA